MTSNIEYLTSDHIISAIILLFAMFKMENKAWVFIPFKINEYILPVNKIYIS